MAATLSTSLKITVVELGQARPTNATPGTLINKNTKHSLVHTEPQTGIPSNQNAMKRTQTLLEKNAEC